MQPDELVTALPGMRQHLPRSIVRAVMLDVYISQRLSAYEFDDTDLNPHLQIMHVIGQVVCDMQAQGEDCSEQDVMLHWFSRVLFCRDLKQFIPRFQS